MFSLFLHFTDSLCDADKKLFRSVFLCLILAYSTGGRAEGTKQFEPANTTGPSICRITLSKNIGDERIPFALLDCEEHYRLNIRVKNHTNEKIFIGLGQMVDYYSNSTVYKDVKFTIKDPADNTVPGFLLKPTPALGEAGFIETYEQAVDGPYDPVANPLGYAPLIVDPEMNGDYYIEFEIPGDESQMRVLEFFDITVKANSVPIIGRMWSKAWQFSSGSVYSSESATYSSFFVYTNDSIVTRFNCNGLAGGVWTIYSNEWGCATTGTWSDRRQSTPGNASVVPQHKIFLNNPDPTEFPSGTIGEMLDFKVLPHECDTVITFWSEVSKAGNIEILLDIPPLNPNTFGPEDVQLGYNVNKGTNTLLPGWNGKNAYGVALENGTVIEARIRFLNGLSNIPLYDVEDNPNGFIVDLIRPQQTSGAPPMRIYWDDTKLSASYNPTSNSIYGCESSNVPTAIGCHEWTTVQNLGDVNTINSWWFFTSGQTLLIPITLKFSPTSPAISGPSNVCSGMLATFKTTAIPFTKKYVWHVTGPGFSYDAVKTAPDTSFSYQFTEAMEQGNYVISVFGQNDQCGDGVKAYFTSYVYNGDPPAVTGEVEICLNQPVEFALPGTYISINWSATNGTVLGSPNANPVSVKWNTIGNDTIRVLAATADCGSRLSLFPVKISIPASTGFYIDNESTTCPGIPLQFTDTSSYHNGSITGREWNWGDGHTEIASSDKLSHSFEETGIRTVTLQITNDKGCKNTATRQVNVIPFPKASFSASRNCAEHQVQLHNTSTGESLSEESWYTPNSAATTANLNSSNPLMVFHTTGNFPVRLIVTNSYGCRDTVIDQVEIHKNPEADFSFVLPCQGAGIAFTGSSVPGDTIISTYSWKSKSVDGTVLNYSGNPATLFFGQPTPYQVEFLVADALGCTDTVRKDIPVEPKPTGNFSYTANADNIRGKLEFHNHTTGATGYSWDFGNGGTASDFEPSFKYTSEGSYLIRLISESAAGCYDTVYKEYYYMPGLWMPNAFTPDNDGLNDVLKPVTQRNSLSPYLFNIYNRWGQLIFSTTNPEEGWDGKLNGEPCQVQTYTFLLQYADEDPIGTGTLTLRGTVRLIR